MSDLYKKLYLYLVGQIDDTLEYMENTILQQQFTEDHAYRAMAMLTHALLTAEEQYLADGENPAPGGNA